MTAAAVLIGAAVRDLCDDLDRILDRVIQPDPVLRIVKEQEGLPTWMSRWTVINTVTGERMLPWTRNLGFALRFGVVFVEKHPGSSLDESFGAFSELGGETATPIAAPAGAATGEAPPPSNIAPADTFSLAWDRWRELLRDAVSAGAEARSAPVGAAAVEFARVVRLRRA